MIKEDHKYYWICDNYLVDYDVKIRDHCYITGKYRGAAHRDYNTNVSLNYKISIMYRNLKNYDAHLTVQGLENFDFEINDKQTKRIRKIYEF